MSDTVLIRFVFPSEPDWELRLLAKEENDDLSSTEVGPVPYTSDSRPWLDIWAHNDERARREGAR